MKRAANLLLFGLTVLGGCKLVDQRDFDRTADKPPFVKPPAPVPGAGPVPLVAIGFPSSPADWSGQLKIAVDLARSRKPNVLFRVESAVPQAGDPQQAASALLRAAADARAVADQIVADGVDRGQVELTAVTDPKLSREEIRIFVR